MGVLHLSTSKFLGTNHFEDVIRSIILTLTFRCYFVRSLNSRSKISFCQSNSLHFSDDSQTYRSVLNWIYSLKVSNRLSVNTCHVACQNTLPGHTWI